MFSITLFIKDAESDEEEIWVVYESNDQGDWNTIFKETKRQGSNAFDEQNSINASHADSSQNFHVAINDFKMVSHMTQDDATVVAETDSNEVEAFPCISKAVSPYSLAGQIKTILPNSSNEKFKDTTENDILQPGTDVNTVRFQAISPEDIHNKCENPLAIEDGQLKEVEVVNQTIYTPIHITIHAPVHHTVFEYETASSFDPETHSKKYISATSVPPSSYDLHTFTSDQKAEDDNGRNNHTHTSFKKLPLI